jgi:high-affinity iron transporter
METALLIATALFQLQSSSVFGGLAMGLVAAAVIGFAWTRLGRGVDLPALLNVSAVFLAIFLVQLLLYSVHEFSEAGLLPNSQAIHDATEILGPDGLIGHLLAYALAVIPTVWLAAAWWKRRHSPAHPKRRPRTPPNPGPTPGCPRGRPRRRAACSRGAPSRRARRRGDSGTSR